MNVEEMGQCPWHHEVHGADFSHYAFQVLSAYPVLGGGDIHQVEELLELPLWAGWHIPFSLTLPNLWGNSKVKSPSGITPGITPDITSGITSALCLLRATRVMTVTLNFLEG